MHGSRFVKIYQSDFSACMAARQGRGSICEFGGGTNKTINMQIIRISCCAGTPTCGPCHFRTLCVGFPEIRTIRYTSIQSLAQEPRALAGSRCSVPTPSSVGRAPAKAMAHPGFFKFLHSVMGTIVSPNKIRYPQYNPYITPVSISFSMFFSM